MMITIDHRRIERDCEIYSYKCENIRRVEISNKLLTFSNSIALIRINPCAMNKLVKASHSLPFLCTRYRVRYAQQPRNA